MRSKSLCSVLFVAAFSWVIGLLVASGPAVQAVTIDWVTVGDPRNAADDTGYGDVNRAYRIGKYEVTNAQYAEFLNAVAATDTNGLYNTEMGDPSAYKLGAITRSGNPGTYTYSTVAGREDMPVNWVSFYDSLRFANWLHNGQPTGAQDSTTTENGAYGMFPESIWDWRFIWPHKHSATIFLPSEDEWYKAAYYDPVSASYVDYPAGSDVQTTCAAPGATANTANCDFSVGDLTDVGSYTDSPSPYGTLDQGGNVREWTETRTGWTRVLRGGRLYAEPGSLAASNRVSNHPAVENSSMGFRVAATIPEPSTALLLTGGLAGLALRRRLSA